MSDNDLIRRGEVRELLQQCGLMGNHPNDPLTVMFNAIPAVQPTVSPDVSALVDALDKTTAHGQRVEYSRVGHALSEASWHVHLAGFRCHDDAEAFLRAALARVKGVV